MEKKKTVVKKPSDKLTKKISDFFAKLTTAQKVLVITAALVVVAIPTFFIVTLSNNDIYTVTFVDYDGTILEKHNVKKGTMPVFGGNVSRESDSNYNYEFLSWDKPIDRVNADVVYTAVYNPISKKNNSKTSSSTDIVDITSNKVTSNIIEQSETESYYITFFDSDGSTLQLTKFKAGSMPVYTGKGLNKTEGGYTYTFKGWNPSLSLVDGEKQYFATYTKTPVSSNSNTQQSSDIEEEKKTTATIYYKSAVTNAVEKCEVKAKSTIILAAGDFAYSDSSQSKMITAPEAGKELSIVSDNYTPKVPKDSGYVFSGYIFDSQALSFTAKYSKLCNITFYLGDYADTSAIVPGQQTVIENNLVKKPNDPKPDIGWAFEGWYTSDEYLKEEKWNFNSKVTGNLNLYAHWVKGQYSVNFNTFNICQNPEKKTVEHGLPVEEPNIDEVHGYILTGWYVDGQSSDIPWDFYDPITSNITLNAIWEKETYTINFVNNGHGIGPDSTTATYNEPIKDLYNLSETGYVFLGWYSDESLEEKYLWKPEYLVKDHLTLYAKWTEGQVKVYFDTDNKCDNPEPYDAIVGGIVKEPKVSATGWTLLGWFAEGSQSPWNFKESCVGNKDLYLKARWQKTVYTIYFDMNYDNKLVGENPGNRTAEHGKPIDNFPVPSKTGYVFRGWYTSKDDFSEDNLWNIDEPVTSDIKYLYAYWQKAECIVHFDTKGYCPNPKPLELCYGDYVSEPKDVFATGYSVTGWYTVDENSTWDFAKDTLTDSSITLHAIWQPNTYIVSFNNMNHGEKVSNQEIKYNNPLNFLPVLEQAEYDFLGWYSDPSYEEKYKWEADTKVTGITTLYAYWKIKTFNVFYHTEYGEVKEKDVVDFGDVVSKLPVLEFSGQKFKGWYTSSSFEEDSKWEDSFIVIDDIDLYAKWVPTDFVVQFDAKGICKNPTPIEVEKDGYIDAPTLEEVSNYVFKGWYKNEDYLEENKWDFKNDKVTSSFTLVAKWNKIHTVTFDLKGLADNIVTKVENGLPVNKPLKDPDIYGYEFLGWVDNSQKEYDFNSKIENDTVIYANFKKNTYTVEFDLMYSTSTHIDNIPVEYNETIKNLPTPERVGHIFKGWYTGSEYLESQIFNSSSKVTDDVILYARWDLASYDVIFHNMDHGEKPDNKIVQYNNVIKNIPVLSEAGFAFKGWFTKETLEDEYLWHDDDLVTKNLDLYAKWVESDFTVSFDVGGKCDDISSVEVEKDGYVPKPKNVKADHFILEGWYLSTNYLDTEKWDFEKDKVTENITLHAKWVESCIVTLDLKGLGDNITFEVIKGQKFNRPESDPKIEGYEFAGWQDKDGKDWNFETIINEDVSIFAKFYELEFVVSFDNKNIGEEQADQIIKYNKPLDFLPILNQYGYDFLGWFTDEKCTAENEWKVDRVVTEKTVLFAKWEKIKYTVTFDNKNIGVKPANREIPYDEIIDDLPELHDTNNIMSFRGWYTKDDFKDENKWLKTSKVIKDTNLIAKWENADFTVLFDTLGYCENPTPAICPVNKTINEPKNVKANGYILDGWYKNTQYKESDKWDFEKDVVNGSFTLFAKWSKLYNVTVDFGGLSDNINITVKEGDMVDFSLISIPSTYGYKFDGWKDKDNKDWANRVINEDVTIFANYTKIEYQVTFHDLIHNTTTPSKNVPYNEKINDLPSPTFEGYRFAGWYTDKDCTATSKWHVGDKVTKNIDLYANWEILYFQITFTDNLFNNVVEGFELPYNSKIKNLPEFSHVGYEFDGWYTNESFAEDTKWLNDSVVKGETHLFAHWIAKKIKVKLETGDYYTFPDSNNYIEVDYDGKVIIPEEIKNDNYDFKCWYLNDTQIEWNFETDTVTEPITLRASYTPGVYTITFVNDDEDIGPSLILNTRTVTYNNPINDFPILSPYSGIADYEFSGWYTSEKYDEGTLWNKDDVVKGPNRNITLYAKWTKKVYTITFNTSGFGTQPDPREIKYEEQLGKLPQLYHKGKVFLGWFCDYYPAGSISNNGYKVKEEDIYNMNIELYARWVDATTTVYYDTGGLCPNPDEQYYEEYKYITPPVLPIVDGVEFAGWVLDPKYHKEVYGVENYNLFDFNTITTACHPELKLNAVWTCIIDLYYSDEPKKEQSHIYATYNKNFNNTVLSYNHDRPGYEFDGFFTDPSCSDESKLDFDKENIITKRTSLYLKYTKLHTVSFTPGGNLPEIKEVVRHGECATWPPESYEGDNPILRDGFEFIRWVNVDGSEWNKNQPINEDTTILAEWKENRIRINYHYGDFKKTTTEFIDFGSTPNIPELVNPPLGFTIDGWYDSEVGGNKVDFTKKLSGDEKTVYDFYLHLFERFELDISLTEYQIFDNESVEEKDNVDDLFSIDGVFKYGMDSLSLDAVYGIMDIYHDSEKPTEFIIEYKMRNPSIYKYIDHFSFNYPEDDKNSLTLLTDASEKGVISYRLDLSSIYDLDIIGIIRFEIYYKPAAYYLSNDVSYDNVDSINLQFNQNVDTTNSSLKTIILKNDNPYVYLLTNSNLYKDDSSNLVAGNYSSKKYLLSKSKKYNRGTYYFDSDLDKKCKDAYNNLTDDSLKKNIVEREITLKNYKYYLPKDSVHYQDRVKQEGYVLSIVKEKYKFNEGDCVIVESTDIENVNEKRYITSVSIEDIASCFKEKEITQNELAALLNPSNDENDFWLLDSAFTENSTKWQFYYSAKEKNIRITKAKNAKKDFRLFFKYKYDNTNPYNTILDEVNPKLSATIEVEYLDGTVKELYNNIVYKVDDPIYCSIDGLGSSSLLFDKRIVSFTPTVAYEFVYCNYIEGKDKYNITNSFTIEKLSDDNTLEIPIKDIYSHITIRIKQKPPIKGTYVTLTVNDITNKYRVINVDGTVAYLIADYNYNAHKFKGNISSGKYMRWLSGTNDYGNVYKQRGSFYFGSDIDDVFVDFYNDYFNKSYPDLILDNSIKLKNYKFYKPKDDAKFKELYETKNLDYIRNIDRTPIYLNNYAIVQDKNKFTKGDIVIIETKERGGSKETSSIFESPLVRDGIDSRRIFSIRVEDIARAFGSHVITKDQLKAVFKSNENVWLMDSAWTDSKLRYTFYYDAKNNTLDISSGKNTKYNAKPYFGVDYKNLVTLVEDGDWPE